MGRYISIESKIEKTKIKYYEVLEQENPMPFVKYLLGIILVAYRDFESRINLVDDKLPAIKQVRVAIKEKIDKFTKSEIMELVPSIGKASVENSLKNFVGLFGYQEEAPFDNHKVGGNPNDFYRIICICLESVSDTEADTKYIHSFTV